MSRSYKKTPICGNAISVSDKKGKQIANRKFRCAERTLINSSRFDDLPINMNQVYNVWSLPKDGKRYFGRMKDDFSFNTPFETYHETYIKQMRK